MPRAIYKQDIPIDDSTTTINVPFSGNGEDRKHIVHAGITEATKPHHISVWFNAAPDADDTAYGFPVRLRVCGTGHPMPDRARHVATVIDPIRPPLVWHVMEVFE